MQLSNFGLLTNSHFEMWFLQTLKRLYQKPLDVLESQSLERFQNIFQRKRFLINQRCIENPVKLKAINSLSASVALI